MLLEPNRTPYDLRWRMLGTDVRVHPLFWLVSAVLGWNWYSMRGGGIGYLLLWVFCCFVSVLLHEFGHVLVGRLFGSDGHIVLYSFGGLAVGSSDLRRRWQRVLVLFGGPGAQLVLAGDGVEGAGTVVDREILDWQERVRCQLHLDVPGRGRVIEGEAVLVLPPMD